MLLCICCICSEVHGEGCDTDNGWHSRDGHCYYVSLMEQEIMMSWDEARDFCNQNGGDLVTLHSEEESTFIRGLVRISFYHHIISYSFQCKLPLVNNLPQCRVLT